MNRFSSRIRLTLVAAGLAATLAPAAVFAAADAVNVEISTTEGVIALRLDPVKSPETVKNFLAYAEKGFYDNTIFHRVIDGFMIQGGGFTADMRQKATDIAIVNEARNGVSNRRGTIAMARTSEPHSATSQFFINVEDNTFLDAREAQDGWGYAVFGRVTRGMDVVDKIAQAKTGRKAGMSDVPVKTVTIRSVKIVK